MQTETMTAIVDRFVSEVTSTVRKQVHDELIGTLNSTQRNGGKRRSSNRKRRSSNLAVRQRKASRNGEAVKPEKVLAHLKKNPGQRGEQISEALGVTTQSLRPVLNALREEKIVKATGKRRGMKYAAV